MPSADSPGAGQALLTGSRADAALLAGFASTPEGLLFEGLMPLQPVSADAKALAAAILAPQAITIDGEAKPVAANDSTLFPRRPQGIEFPQLSVLPGDIAQGEPSLGRAAPGIPGSTAAPRRAEANAVPEGDVAGLPVPVPAEPEAGVEPEKTEAEGPRQRPQELSLEGQEGAQRAPDRVDLPVVAAPASNPTAPVVTPVARPSARSSVVGAASPTTAGSVSQSTDETTRQPGAAGPVSRPAPGDGASVAAALVVAPRASAAAAEGSAEPVDLPKTAMVREASSPEGSPAAAADRSAPAPSVVAPGDLQRDSIQEPMAVVAAQNRPVPGQTAVRSRAVFGPATSEPTLTVDAPTAQQARVSPAAVVAPANGPTAAAMPATPHVPVGSTDAAVMPAPSSTGLGGAASAPHAAPGAVASPPASSTASVPLSPPPGEPASVPARPVAEPVADAAVARTADVAGLVDDSPAVALPQQVEGWKKLLLNAYKQRVKSDAETVGIKDAKVDGAMPALLTTPFTSAPSAVTAAGTPEAASSLPAEWVEKLTQLTARAERLAPARLEVSLPMQGAEDLRVRVSCRGGHISCEFHNASPEMQRLFLREWPGLTQLFGRESPLRVEQPTFVNLSDPQDRSGGESPSRREREERAARDEDAAIAAFFAGQRKSHRRSA